MLWAYGFVNKVFQFVDEFFPLILGVVGAIAFVVLLCTKPRKDESEDEEN